MPQHEHADSRPVRRNSWTPAAVGAAAIGLILWFAAAWAIGTTGLFANDPASVVPPVAITVVGPVVVFLAAYAMSVRFRAFVLAQDLRLLTMLQHWRIIGFGFLPLYFYGVLPGVFAWPTALGDVAIGVAAAFMIARIDRDPDYATSRGFVSFHGLGLLDFAVAVASAGLTTGRFPALVADGVTSAPMAVWPLNLFPSFGVPLFIILHLVVLLKVRHLRRAGAARPVVMTEAA